MPGLAVFDPGEPGPSIIARTQSLMSQVAARRRADEAQAIESAKFEILRPVLESQAQATAAEMRTKYDVAINTQQARAAAYDLYQKASADFNFINTVTDDKQRANLSREWLSRYSQLANVAELKGEMDVKNHLATSNIEDMLKINMLKTAEVRSFEELTKDMTPEQVQQAKMIRAGLAGRASNAGQKVEKFIGPDGRARMMTFDPRTGSYSVVGEDQPLATGQRPQAPAQAGAVNAAPPELSGDVVLNEPQPATPAAQPQPSAGPNRFASQTPGEKVGQETTAKEQAQYQQKLIQDKPKRQAALQMAEATSTRLSDEIDDLVKKVTSATAGPGGVILNKFPGTTAKDFEANLSSIKAVIGFQTLQAMRDASPTGGALGQVSDFENKLLQAQLGNLEVGQSPAQLIENLKKVKQRVIENFGINRAAFANQYGESHADALPDLKSMSDEQLQKRLREIRGQP